MLSHSTDRPFKCETCDKTFTQTSDISRHPLTHTFNKAHTCKTCYKAFRLKGILKQHLLTHSKETPFKCELCDYHTACKSNLTMHNKRRHDIKTTKIAVTQDEQHHKSESTDQAALPLRLNVDISTEPDVIVLDDKIDIRDTDESTVGSPDTSKSSEAGEWDVTNEVRVNSSFGTIGSQRKIQEADSCDMILECSTPDEKPTLDSSDINYVDVNQSNETSQEYCVCDVKIENNDPNIDEKPATFNEVDVKFETRDNDLKPVIDEPDEKPIVDGGFFGCQQ